MQESGEDPRAPSALHELRMKGQGPETRLSIPSCGGCCIPESGWFAHESKKDAAGAPRLCRDLTKLESRGTRLPSAVQTQLLSCGPIVPRHRERVKAGRRI